ncbi:type II asparaginase [Massilia sp. GCM10023247]|uniref:type II asparaginase n=1 Tax=Massilia sp. GCM10023247 TaxID=3252643 RepID=UPI00361B5DB2
MLFQRSTRSAAALFGFLFCLALASTAQAESAARLPNVTILATGGTIAGTGATSTTTVGYTAATVGVQALIAAVPEMTKIAKVSGEQVLQIASENMGNEHWLLLAKRVNTLLGQSNVDGIVITHGTDTLEETAYFLNLVVKSKKPVVVVGSMRPSTALSADGPINLYNAVMLAGSTEAVGRGVLVAMNDQIHGARDVTKANTTTTDTFRAAELGMLGYIQGGKPYFYRAPLRRHTVETEFDVTNLSALPAVEVAYAYANVGPAAVEALVATGAKGLVHAGVGNGSLPAKVRPALSAARKQGVIIVRSSRVGQGIVARNGEANDDELDFVAGDNLSPQKARILLMLALTRTNNTREIQRMFSTY